MGTFNNYVDRICPGGRGGAGIDLEFRLARTRPVFAAKSGFFSESAIHFSNLPISKEKIFQKTILNFKFKFPAKNPLLLLAGNLNFKLRIVFWNIFFWRFGDLKKTSHFLEKKTFRDYSLDYIFFRNKTFLLFKMESWNCQHLFKNEFRDSSQNFNSIR